MRYKCIITTLNQVQQIVGIGFLKGDWDIIKPRLQKYYMGDKWISVEIDGWVPPKTQKELGLFHVLCRKIAKDQNDNERNIKAGILHTYGTWIDNPLNPVGDQILKDLKDYTDPEMHPIIEGAFKEGHELGIDLQKQYEEYKKMKEKKDE